MGQVLAICDYEKQYVFRLAEYLNSQKLLPFEVLAFDDVEKLIAFEKTNAITILLVGDTLQGAWMQSLHVGQIIVLVSDQESVENPEFSIQKYQSANMIAKSILNICCDFCNHMEFHSMSQRHTSIIGVYSPIGRCLKSSFAIVMGQLLSKHKKCLYVNLEPYSGFSPLIHKNSDGGNMTELLFYLNQSPDRFLLKLRSIVETIGDLDYIPPTGNFMDLQEISKESWIAFVDILTGYTDYEVIILDLADYVHGLFDLLSKCTSVYTIIRRDGISMAKQEQYEEMLSFTNYSNLINQSKKIQLPIFKQLPRQIENLSKSELADYVKRIIQEDNL